MSIKYVPLPISTKEFLKGRNPTSQPGEKLPHYNGRPAAFMQENAFVRGMNKGNLSVLFVAAVNKPDDFTKQEDTINPYAITQISMAMCREGEYANQTNTCTFFPKGFESHQEMWNAARNLVQHVQNGMSLHEARQMLDYAPKTTADCIETTGPEVTDIDEHEEEI